MDNPMFGLDLFSGIGGITIALSEWVRPIAYCEIDRYCQGVLLSRMSDGSLPTAPIWDDVQTLKGDMLPIKPGIIYGGFPCQDISVAGRGAGLAGKRSGLFSEIARLVGEIRPRFVFLENVPAINLRGQDTVICTLTDLGYDCRWTVVSAAEVGANHLRRRWFCLGYLENNCRCQRGRQVTNDLNPKSEVRGENVADTDRQHSKEQFSRDKLAETIRQGAFGRGNGNGNGNWWAVEPDVVRVAHGVSMRVDRLKGLGNAVVPLQAKEAFKRLITLGYSNE